MKAFAPLLLAALAAAGAHAQAPSTATSRPASAQATPANPAPAGTARRATSRTELAPGAQKAVEERTPVDEEFTRELTPAEIEVARAVHVGEMRCELGTVVRVIPTRREGYFMVVTNKGHRFRMHPHESRTGAIRLEDPRRGAMWLQLGNKSMLMSQKLGQRIADECQSPEQVTYAEALKRNPLPGILDAQPPVPGAPHPHMHPGGMHGEGHHGCQRDAPAVAQAEAPPCMAAPPTATQ